MTMVQRSYTVRFLTPAFLGDANQSGCWRTPPFKHLLREWWRVVWATGNDPQHWKEMRSVEGRLLGHAWLDDDTDERGGAVAGRKSTVRLRLAPWVTGNMNNMPRTAPADIRGGAVASALYLGYGPVKDATHLKNPPAIDPDQTAELSIAYDPERPGAEHFEDTLRLIHAFGTVGGRARNGWGSLHLEGQQTPLGDEFLPGFVRPWESCLAAEWPHAIGADDEGPLIWTTEDRKEDGWKGLIEELARIRKSVNGAVGKSGRPILSQPVAGKGGRIPSTLRFKVRKAIDGYQGIVFHMPYTPPSQRGNSNAASIWRRVHEHLDSRAELRRAAP